MTTANFKVEFIFEGSLADNNELDGSDHETAISASRRLLALHTHCSLTGKLPTAAMSETRRYHIRHVASVAGSHIDVWNVVINSPWTVQVVGGVIVAAYADETRRGINACGRFLRDSVRSALDIGPRHLPHFPRTEPVFEAFGGNHQPIVDVVAEHQTQRAGLREVTIRVLHDVARPVGRSAGRLSIVIDGELAVTIDEVLKRRSLAEQIGKAVEGLRDGPEFRQRRIF